jgi:predicted ArsR family transcriptional regulator
MLAGLLGSDDAERILLFLAARERGYGREIASFWHTSLNGVQRQLDKLEASGILISVTVGRTRVYTWSPRWPFIGELKALLTKALGFLPEELGKRLLDDRRRPRRRSKPA